MTAELWRVDQSPEEAIFSTCPQPPTSYCALYSSRPLPSPVLDKSSQAHSCLMLLWERAAIWKLLIELVFLECCENWNCPLQLQAALTGGRELSIVFRNMACGLLPCQPPPPDGPLRAQALGFPCPQRIPRALYFPALSPFLSMTKDGMKSTGGKELCLWFGGGGRAEPHTEQIRIHPELWAGKEERIWSGRSLAKGTHAGMWWRKGQSYMERGMLGRGVAWQIGQSPCRDGLHTCLYSG